jgi:hypothetical protein
VCVGRSVGIIEHLPDPDERDFGGALCFGEAPHGGWDVVRTSWTFDGSDVTFHRGPTASVSVSFMNQWTQILHYRRVEELVGVAPGGR